MQLSSRILTALAVLILAVAVVAVRGGGGVETVEAATGTIDVLNVGTCYATDTDVFSVGNCDDEDDTEGYNVAGRDSITKADDVYATYAIDPKTSGDAPRAILKNADLIKISIEDEGRDKRTGVLYQVGEDAPTTLTKKDDNGADVTITFTDATGQANVVGIVNDALSKKDVTVIETFDDTDDTADGYFEKTPAGAISGSGNEEFRLNVATHPMASEREHRGKVRWFGTYDSDAENQGTADENELRDLTGDFIVLDEDLSSGERATDSNAGVAPWMRVTASIPQGGSVTVHYIYYQTSDEEDLIGGQTLGTGYNIIDGEENSEVNPPDFDDDDTGDTLELRASSDGDVASQNLWLKETSLFSGRYEGYLRLTDADGDGGGDLTSPTRTSANNWGLATNKATGPGKDVSAVLGVESGPVTITYKDSNGGDNKVTILIDHSPPTIQIESPVNGVSSKDDSPELLGSFTDSGGSDLREDSFKVYVDNTDDENDDHPVWDFNVLSSSDKDRGKVCIDGDDDNLTCGDGDPNVLSVRAEYAGFTDTQKTFGILSGANVYLSETDGTAGRGTDDEDDFKIGEDEGFEDGDSSGIFDTVVRIDFSPGGDNPEYNNTIDLQAVVMDIAGNIGFSDADPSDPTFIHDLGTAAADRDDKIRDNKVDAKHNVLGWYSRHVYYLDDVDPYFKDDQSASGFFVDADGDEARTSSGLMLAFDNDLDASTVGVGTFEVELDDGTEGTVTEVAVDGRKVYLKLEEELAPNATPKVELAGGQAISDLAGNESTSRRLDGIELKDGILPTLTIELSGGSGLHEDIDGQGPSELTKDQINIVITSNEAIQGAPKFAVVCNDLTWDDNDKNNVAKFASNRTNAFKSGDIDKQAPNLNEPVFACDRDDFDVAVTSALARPGNRWEYQWSNLSGEQAVVEGKLSVIVWGRDRSSYDNSDGNSVHNYSASTAGFTFDETLETAWGTDEGLVPDEGEDVFEPRPFVLLDFGKEWSRVNVTKFEVDGVDYTADLEILEGNEFVWWPDPLAHGTYSVNVEANDAANNTGEHTYKFNVKPRSPFTIDLLAGWNSISFPANPVDRALHAVFTDPAVDQVIGWNVTEPVSPWRMATRADGVWTTSDDYATLNDVEARYGYWVHSTGFIKQSVHLSGKTDRSYGGQPSPSDIPTDPGWNFVGVVDVDGDQTQDHAGETLRNSKQDPITAAEYLGDYVRAYTWDHVNNSWDVVKENEGITIGTGVWVFYGSGIAP